uniref:Uncharacterized protein n=1 Tax=Panagrolaimus davidi TaxID=227884 RepID=A0A914QYS8_9BILA
MDSSVCQRIISYPKREAQDSMVVSCTRAKFMATFYQQDFSLPDSLIFYIATNPKTAELYLKMIKTCKYFFVKNPIIIIDCLDTFGGKWRVNEKPLDLTKYNCKYWITDVISVSASVFVDKNILSTIIPKLYQCDVKCLSISHQIISFNDLSFIISSAEEIYFNNVIVKKCNSVIPLEGIIEIAVCAKSVNIFKPTITTKTMKELTKLSHFLKLYDFTLHDLSEVFDLDAFYSYMKKNQDTQFFLTFFDEQISEGYMNRLETIVDEILETKQFNYEPPVINFTGLDIQKYKKLYRIYLFH